MSRHRRASRPLGRRLALTVLAVVVAAALALVDLPAAFGGFVPRVANNGNTAATGTYFTCGNAALGETGTKAYFNYPLGDTGGTTVTDASGNNRPGTYSNVTLGVANTGTGSICPRDKKSVVSLNGFSSYIAGPSAGVSSPANFSVEIWFKTVIAAGMLVSFSNNRTASATTRIAQVYIDTTARVRFSLLSGGTRYSTANADSVVGNGWHHALATFSATAGMAFYVDGVATAAPSPNPKTIDSVGTNTGYWKFGMEDMSSLPVRSYTGYFAGNLAYASEYGYALTATQAKAHYAAGL